MHGRVFPGLVVLITAISIGCGGGSGTNRAVPAGALAASPSVLDFGKVAVGDHKAKIGALTAGDSSITVTSADWGGEGYSIAGIVFPLTIHAGQSVPFKVIFSPHRAGSSAGKISFLSDAENAAQTNFSGNGTQTGGHSVTLSWQPAAAAVEGYNIYRALAAHGTFTRLNGSPHPKATFTDATVMGGETYFYMTTAVNKNGKESKYSNQIQITIPNS